MTLYKPPSSPVDQMNNGVLTGHSVRPLKFGVLRRRTQGVHLSVCEEQMNANRFRIKTEYVI